MTALGQTVFAFSLSQPVAPEVPSYGAQLVQTLIALVVVCILAYVILRWGLARLMGPRAKQGPMTILARMSLDGRQGLLVVRVADRVFLLGTGGNAPRLLAELNPETWAEQATHWADGKRPSLFERVLQTMDKTRSTAPGEARKRKDMAFDQEQMAGDETSRDDRDTKPREN